MNLLLNAFGVGTVSYEPSLYPLRFMSEAQSVWAMNCTRKDKDRNLEYDKTKLVGCSLYLISYISCPFSRCLTGMENDFYLCVSKAKRVNLELNRCTSLARLKVIP